MTDTECPNCGWLNPTSKHGCIDSGDVTVRVPRALIDAVRLAPPDEWRDAPVLGPNQAALLALGRAVAEQAKEGR